MRSQRDTKRLWYLEGMLSNMHSRYFFDIVLGHEVTPNKELMESILVWWEKAKDTYRDTNSKWAVSKRDYTALVEELNEYETRLRAGEHEKEAKHILSLVREWVELAIAYRVALPSNGKCLVY